MNSIYTISYCDVVLPGDLSRAVYNHWTGLLDWTGGLDWRNDTKNHFYGF